MTAAYEIADYAIITKSELRNESPEGTMKLVCTACNHEWSARKNSTLIKGYGFADMVMEDWLWGWYQNVLNADQALLILTKR